jgi:PKD repeat protein
MTDANDSYQDYTCSNSTTLIAGTKYPFEIYVNGNIFYENPAENVRIWIDYNNDGAFDDVNEVAFSKDNDTTIIKGYIQIPLTATQNTPLRLRVMDDKKSSAITGSCFNPKSGQCEDYAVIVLPSSAAPVADFSGLPTTIDIGQSVNFTDFSVNTPTTWQWTFEGGTPSTSGDENPSGVIYTSAGSYDVTLIVSNDFGSDTIVKENYITVNPAFDLCEYTVSTYNEGGFFDPGGVFNKYDNNENCSLLISPACAGPITLAIASFASQSPNDALNIYDGADEGARLRARSRLDQGRSPHPHTRRSERSSRLFRASVARASPRPRFRRARNYAA